MTLAVLDFSKVVFKGTGEMGQMICVATSEGLVKGMVSNPNANSVREDGSVDVPSIVGSGIYSYDFWASLLPLH